MLKTAQACIFIIFEVVKSRFQLILIILYHLKKVAYSVHQQLASFLWGFTPTHSGGLLPKAPMGPNGGPRGRIALPILLFGRSRFGSRHQLGDNQLSQLTLYTALRVRLCSLAVSPPNDTT